MKPINIKQKMKARQIKLFGQEEDIPLHLMLDKLLKAEEDLPVGFENARIRIEYSEEYTRNNPDYEVGVYRVYLLYNSPMSEAEIQELKKFLEDRSAKQEAEDKLTFERLKTRYGWT
jgi:hypothetical protein